MVMLSVFVPGEPRPQAALRMSPSGHAYHATKGLQEWRDAILGRCLLAAGRQKWPQRYKGPVVADAVFLFTRPKQPTYDYPIIDLDHLCRAVGDALQPLILADDKHIVEWQARKRFAPPGSSGGLRLTLVTP